MGLFLSASALSGVDVAGVAAKPSILSVQQKATNFILQLEQQMTPVY
jgi:hypothetical protein